MPCVYVQLSFGQLFRAWALALCLVTTAGAVPGREGLGGLIGGDQGDIALGPGDVFQPFGAPQEFFIALTDPPEVVRYEDARVHQGPSLLDDLVAFVRDATHYALSYAVNAEHQSDDRADCSPHGMRDEGRWRRVQSNQGSELRYRNKPKKQSNEISEGRCVIPADKEKID